MSDNKFGFTLRGYRTTLVAVVSIGCITALAWGLNSADRASAIGQIVALVALVAGREMGRGTKDAG